jgi:uroporphyrinogen-III synthase
MAQPMPVLLMTRPVAASNRFVADLKAEGLTFRPVISPLFTVETTGPLPRTDDIRGLIFTSSNGVSSWLALGGRTDLPVYTVGAATARTARLAGMTAHSADGNVDDLRDWLLNLSPPGPLLHAHGTHVRGDLAARLSQAGLSCRSVVIYDQPKVPLTRDAREALIGRAPVVIPVFSPRSGQLLLSERAKAPILVAAMSEAVAKALAPLHKQELKVARRPESLALQEVVSDLLIRASAGDF